MKLKRPKGEEASDHQLPVMVGNVEYTIANLQRSGINHAFIVLFGYKDEWHEIDIRQFVPTTHLEAFKEHVESNALTLVDLGIESAASEEPKSIQEMQHEHYEKLASLFPAFPYYMISNLHRHLSTRSETPIFQLKACLSGLQARKQSIDDFIAMSLFEDEKQGIKTPVVENDFITNEHGVIINPDTDYEYLKGGANVRLWTGQFKDGTWGNGLHISSANKEGVVYPVSVQMKSPTKDRALQSAYSRALYVLKGQMTMGATSLNEPFTEIQNLLNTMTKQSKPEIVEEIPNAPIESTIIAEKEKIAPIGEYVSDESGPNEARESVESIETTESTESTEQPKRALSITVIGGLQPEKIQEFKDLKKNQEKIVKANPFIEVKDKESLEKARTAASNLLKASTAIDGKQKGLADVTKKAFNTLKKTVDDFLLSASIITRTPYDKQKAAIDTYVNAEELRIAAEREAELKRVKDRTDTLYAIPMLFNGEVYSIGSVYILPSQINEMSDEEFNKVVAQAKVVAETEKSAAQKIAELEAELAKYKAADNPAPEVVTTVVVEAISAPEPEVREVEGLQQYVIPDSPTVTEVPKATTAAPSAEYTVAKSQYPYGYEPGTELVPANNKPLQDFDTAYVSVIAMQPVPAPFIKCREYFRMGLKAAMTEVDAIMKSTPAEGQPSKPDQIKSLIASILD